MPTPFAPGTSRTSSPSPSSWRRASHSATVPECLARLEAEHDNLDTALEWGDGAAATEEMLRFATALTLFWELRGHLAKGGRWFARVLRDDDAPPTVERARALWGAAHVALYGDDFETMQLRAPQALGDGRGRRRRLGRRARPEHARVRNGALRSGGRPRPTGAQHRARTQRAATTGRSPTVGR